jgi:hypothetical protein
MLGHACETLAAKYLQRGPPIAESKSTTHRTHRRHRRHRLESDILDTYVIKKRIPRRHDYVTVSVTVTVTVTVRSDMRRPPRPRVR